MVIWSGFSALGSILAACFALYIAKEVEGSSRKDKANSSMFYILSLTGFLRDFHSDLIFIYDFECVGGVAPERQEILLGKVSKLISGFEVFNLEKINEFDGELFYDFYLIKDGLHLMREEYRQAFYFYDRGLNGDPILEKAKKYNDNVSNRIVVIIDKINDILKSKI